VAALIIGSASNDRMLARSGQQRSSRSQPTQQFSLSTEEIREAEQRLSDLAYWTGPVDGVLDEGSRQALIAFQKVEGRQRTGKPTQEELQALRTARRPLARELGYAHIEIDLSRQVDGHGKTLYIRGPHAASRDSLRAFQC
jgi:peptidoglycan hydrolase-like protein with peptidoglycan-binding domain